MGRFVQVLLWTDSEIEEVEELLNPDIHECEVLQIQVANDLDGLTHPLQDRDVRLASEELA